MTSWESYLFRKLSKQKHLGRKEKWGMHLYVQIWKRKSSTNAMLNAWRLSIDWKNNDLWRLTFHFGQTTLCMAWALDLLCWLLPRRRQADRFPDFKSKGGRNSEYDFSCYVHSLTFVYLIFTASKIDQKIHPLSGTFLKLARMIIEASPGLLYRDISISVRLQTAWYNSSRLDI